MNFQLMTNTVQSKSQLGNIRRNILFMILKIVQKHFRNY
ncbi:hypothetical protein DES34_101713 [Brevibacillus brevis]|nr:hypothetical protein DES34_101713 [Brevibacillus brevis]VEF88847.1 Uncharacterised protein [Brevibacillus brevis]